jgi:hypothetical protein
MFEQYQEKNRPARALDQFEQLLIGGAEFFRDIHQQQDEIAARKNVLRGRG